MMQKNAVIFDIVLKVENLQNIGWKEEGKLIAGKIRMPDEIGFDGQDKKKAAGY